MTSTSDPVQLWESIQQSGGIDAYVDGQLRERGYLVERQNAEKLSKKKLSDYKKSLKREAAEKKRLKKEAWLAYKANHIVHVGEGIYFNDDDNFDVWDLANAEERAAENELPALDKPAQLAEALGLSIGQLRWLAYHRDAATQVHYRPFTIPKRDGSKRQIWAPLPKLKAAQRWILRHIVEHLPVHGAAHGFLTGRSIASNAAAHTDAKTVLKVDLKDFFPTVTWRRAKGVFRKAGYRDQIATLLALICTEAPREVVEKDGKTYYIAMGPRCLPQGAPTSPGLTNTICLRLDRRLSGLALKLGWRYTRYADDLTFSIPKGHEGPPKLGTLMGSIGRIVADEGFSVHPKKTRVARSGGRQKVTGLVVNGQGEPRVPRKLRREMRAAIHNLKNGKGLKEGESFSRLIGYAAYVCMTQPELGQRFLKDLRELDEAS